MFKSSGGIRSGFSSIILRESQRRTTKTASQKNADVIDEIERNGHSRAEPFAIGKVEKRMKDFAEKEGITLASSSIYIRPHDIGHALRDDKKAKGINVSPEELRQFPNNKKRMALYYDKYDNKFIYTNGTTKYIINPDYKIKIRREKIKVVIFLTATKINNMDEFLLEKYIKV